MAVALVRAVAVEGSEVVLSVRKKPQEPPVQIRIDTQQLPPDLAASLPSGELKIEDGVGEIKLIDQRGRNAHITIAAEHLSNYNVTGWFDTTDPAFEQLQQGQRVGYRIVVRRKKDSLTGQPMVDPSIGILDVGNDVKVRDMTYCGDPGMLPPIVPQFSAPAQALAPTQTAAQRCGWCELPPTACMCGAPDEASAPQGRPSPNCDHGIPRNEHCPHCLGLSSVAVRNNTQRSLMTAATPAVMNQPDVAGAPQSPPQEQRKPRQVGARREEGKPWVLVNTDGTLNLGSYAFDGIVECEALAVELCEEWRQQTRQATGDRDLIRKTTKALMIAADIAQASVRDDGRSDAMDASHKRARYCVRMASKRLLPPFDGRTDDWKMYAHALGEHAAMLLKIAVDLFQEREGVS